MLLGFFFQKYMTNNRYYHMDQVLLFEKYGDNERQIKCKGCVEQVWHIQNGRNFIASGSPK